VDATISGCTTASRTAVVATVTPLPSITGTTPGERCGTGTVTLGATASAGTLNWYAAATGGASLGTGISFTTPSITTTTTYFVDATTAGCTTTNRTAVVATVTAIPNITGTTPGTKCGPGTVTLGATASAGTLNWYAALTGGASLGTGTSFTTPSIASTTTYYVDATQNGCTTISRREVIATVIDEPSAGTANNTSVCNTNESGQPTSLDLDDQLTGADPGDWSLTSFPSGASINIGGNNSVNFSGQPLGNYEFTYTTTDAIAPCTNQFGILTINVIDCTLPCNAGNSAPVLNPDVSTNFCDVIDVSLNDYIDSVAPAGTTLTWSTLSDQLNTNAHLTDAQVANPPNDGSFYAFFYDAANGCASPTLEVEITLNSIPIIVETLGDERCGPGEVILTANGAPDVDQPPTFNWYDSGTGGILVGTGSSISINISTTTSYYVEATANGCTSAREEVIATIYPLPSAGTPSNASACSVSANGPTIVDLDDLITGESAGEWAVTTDPSGTLSIGIGNIVSFVDRPDGDYVLTFTTTDATLPFCDNVSSEVTITVNDCDVDSDGDGLLDGLEITLGTDPNNADTDDDDIEDAVEVGNDTANPLDEDEDGIIDALDSNILDTDMDGVVDWLDPANTNPCVPDPSSEFCVATVDLEIIKTSNDDFLNVNEQLTFTITVTNISDEIATLIQVEEVLDAIGFDYISHFTGPGDGVYDEVAGLWDIPMLDPNESATLVVLVRMIAFGTFTNTATITGSSPVDINPVNDEASVEIEVAMRSNNEPGFLFNQFSPNGDGTNDFLIVNSIEDYPNNSIEIYDRYGNQVFEARPYDNTWDGTRNNSDAPKGTYFYVFDLGDGSEIRKGWIQIIR
ncbi:MAG: gliding motility-associated C-terminal domain-containing protein, partial [Maribacter sp.]